MLTALDTPPLALADSTRRAILALADWEARMMEIAGPLPMSPNGVSKPIRMLERAKPVRRRCLGQIEARQVAEAQARAGQDKQARMSEYGAVAVECETRFAEPVP